MSAEGRVEHQKLNQTTALLLFGWVFGVQLGSLEKKSDSPKTLNREEYEVIYGQPLGVVHKSRDRFSHKSFYFFSSESSWRPKTQPEVALRRRLIEFLVFNSAFGRHRHWLIPMTSPSIIIILMSSLIHHGLRFGGSHRNIKPWWMMDDITMMMNEGDSIGINQCLCLPKAELNTKNSPRRRRKASSGWVFGVQLGLRKT